MEPRTPRPMKADNVAELTDGLKNIRGEIIKFYFSQDQESDAYIEKMDTIIKELQSSQADKRDKLNRNLESVGLTGPLLKDKLAVWKRLLQEQKSMPAAFIGSSFFQSFIKASSNLLPSWVIFALDFLSEFFVNEGGKAELKNYISPS